MSKKYLKKKQRKSWPLLLIVVILLAGLLVGLVLWGITLSKNTQGSITGPEITGSEVTGPEITGPTETTAQVTEPEGTEPTVVVDAAQIKTMYGVFYVSEANADKLVHQEIVQEGVAMERFSARLGQQEKELFRIYFGDGSQGDFFGYFRTDTGDVVISVAVCTYDSSDFTSEEDFALYYTLMEELNVFLSQISNDGRYHSKEEVKETEPQKVETQLEFWDFELPEAVEWIEYDQDSLYWIDFYCTVAGDTIQIYTIYLGETEADTLIGYYTVDGVQKPVWVKVYSVQPGGNWSDEDTVAAYNCVATVNDVIQTIMASENFSEQMPE